MRVVRRVFVSKAVAGWNEAGVVKRSLVVSGAVNGGINVDASMVETDTQGSGRNDITVHQSQPTGDSFVVF